MDECQNNDSKVPRLYGISGAAGHATRPTGIALSDHKKERAAQPGTSRIDSTDFSYGATIMP